MQSDDFFKDLEPRYDDDVDVAGDESFFKNGEEDGMSFDLGDISFNGDDSEGEAGSPKVDLREKSLPEITKRFEDEPHSFFSDPGYYKTALSNEGDISERLHTVFQKYLNAKDPKDRSVYRPQIINSYWELVRSVSKRTPGVIANPKKFMLRFGLLHPNFLKEETRSLFAKLITDNVYNQPIYYTDEWFKAVGTGLVRGSTTDEAKFTKGGNNNQVKINLLLEKATGKYDGVKTLLLGKAQERNDLEQRLKNSVGIVMENSPTGDSTLEGVSACYSDSQKRAFNEIQDILRNLLRCDRETSIFFRDYNQAASDVSNLKTRMEEGDAVETLDLQAIASEFDTIRQATKMTVGRQGNHFPVLTGEYFHCMPNDIGFRENVISILAQIESIDTEVFCRYYKNKLNRIVPFVVLLPSYGDTGICWEPFDKHNRATSRGRVFIPMYPKNLYIAILSAVADLRWQVAKEKASVYWMEEGLTGNYYQWFAANKYKGVVKEFFIRDYILWMTKEVEGIQKLDKTVRGIFWRHMPFSQEVKDKLRTRSYVYQELCQRDANRAMSDGY